MLITGSGGRLGRLMRRAALREGTGAWRVTFQSRRPGADILWSPGQRLDVLPRAALVVALWGRTAGDTRILAENAALVTTSAEVARACGARRLVHLSSAAVYGPGRALCEDSAPRPAGAYGAAKQALEAAVTALGDDGIAHCCLRLANVVGADSLAPALRGPGPVTLDRFADGQGPRRSYITASDVLRVVLALAELPPGALPARLNVAAPQPLSMEALARAAGRSVAWRPAPPEAIQDVTLDTSRLARLLPGAVRLTTAAQMIADWRMLSEDAA